MTTQQHIRAVILVRLIFLTLLIPVTSDFSSVPKSAYAAPSSVVDAGLVAYYPFDGNPNDMSGNGNNGTISGATALTLDRFGNPNSAYHFNGLTDYISVPHNSSIFFSNSQPFSFSIWFKPMSEAISFPILKNANYGVQWRGSSQSILFYDGDYHSTTNTSWQLNQWYHLAMVDNGTDLRLYVNGALDKIDVRTPNRFGDFPLEIGSWITDNLTGKTWFFSGDIDDIRVYNRALAGDEISKIYNIVKINQPVLQFPWSTTGGYGVPVWYLSAGPHCDNIGGTCPINATRYALDFMPPASTNGACSQDRINSGWVTASAAGEVHYAADNLVEIEHGNGFRTGYYHLVDIQVVRGNFVFAGDKLGRPSCEVSQKFGGSNVGVHVHFYICYLLPNTDPTKDFCGPNSFSPAALPMDGIVIAGWTVHESPRNHDGTMSKPGQQDRIAEDHQCGPDDGCSDSQGNSVRNDLPPNLLRNASFELDANHDKKPDTWDTSTHFTQSPGSSTIIPVTGSFMGKFRADDNSNTTIRQSIGGVVVGNTYVFRGWVSIPRTKDSFSFQILLRWYNASGNEIKTDVVQTYSSDTGGTWKQAAAAFVAPKGSSKAQVRMVARNLKGTIYVDDFLFYSQ